MALTADEKKLLEELSAKANEPDEDDFEIEIYDTTKGRGARLPHSKGRAWLFENLGIGENPNPNPEGEEDEGKRTKKDSGGEVRTGYFGRQNAS